MNPLRRWGIALRYEPTGEERASSLIATANPAVAPSLVLVKVCHAAFLQSKELVCMVPFPDFANALITGILAFAE
ncbi:MULTISPECIES: hypothetical protein [unclassified Sporosarcina]|uniref:hypothetical protein n=1 Tax=unclassified Sporosarcina TaxID=2647733 RepID=UPI0020404B18|nr:MULTISPECIES: hypothetical protein [unclassified Sporosarcina]GKV66452.1 hypothetical protein NCCP2331_26050 [Sporosarcina sp. NCCP-2331]GLB56684.1 hypothetical protein NCCP2378_24710 [Sporosarcina sp. NCCP-2378]